MKLFKPLLISQASYILITAIWPLIDIESFMMITGPKHDVWLVKTIGALLIPVSLTMFSFLAIESKAPAIVLGAGVAVSFISIDLYYALTDVISDVYLLDAGIEFIFLIGWIGYKLSYDKQH